LPAKPVLLEKALHWSKIHQGSVYFFAVVLAVLIWSTSFVATKVAYTTFPPLTLGALRFVLAASILGVVLFVKGQFMIPCPGDMGRLTISGVLGITIYFAMENMGVKLTTSSNAALIVASFPATTLFFEILIYRTKISWIKILGIVMAVFGVYLVEHRHQNVMGEEHLLGNALLIGAGIIWTFYNFVTRSVVNKYPMLVISFFQTAAGTIAFIPLAITERMYWQLPTLKSFSMLIFLGIFCSVIAFLLYNYGLRSISSSSAVMLMNFVPVFGVLFSILFLHEKVLVNQFIGGIVIILGVMLNVRQERNHPGKDF